VTSCKAVNSRKRFRCEVMFENEHTSACEYTMFARAQLLRNWCEQRPSSQGDLDSSVAVEIGRVYYAGVDLLLISFLCRSAWLLLRLHIISRFHK
jgi:hypothetical protein